MKPTKLKTQTLRACAIAGGLILLASHTVNASGISGQGTWETTLLARDLDGNAATAEAYYDTALNITWLADANAAGVKMDWAAANAWVSGLSLGGFTDWRLPTVIDTGAPGCTEAYSGTDCGWNVDAASGELAHMFYVTLDNTPKFDSGGNLLTGFGISNSGPFVNLLSSPYWTNQEYALDSGDAWYFNNNGGYQGNWTKASEFYAWGVHDGDIGSAVVPVPAAVWLFTSGMLSLFGFGLKRKQTQ